MRALCGAVISAGALIGLGLAAIGLGTRYQGYVEYEGDSTKLKHDVFVKFSQLDTPLMIILVVLVATLVIGLTIAFLGLAYHHHRRYHELLRITQLHETPKVTVP